jgi:hypothetical protein
LALIEQANSIIAEYDALGFDLTLRQLYYQFVSRDIIPNKVTEYKRLGSVINDARLAGLVDWDSITDRTRNLRGVNTWRSPSDIVRACAEQFKINLWEDQDYRVEVWIEKDALVGVIAGVCEEHRVDYFSCRGYTSQSEMHAAAMRLARYRRMGKTPVILHLGDHDPSGMDMTRDIEDRLTMFMGGPELERLALNMDQIEQFNPPPNPAKETDSRCAGYMAQFGGESWELDALEPTLLAGLIGEAIEKFKDPDRWEAKEEEEAEHRKTLERIASDL